MINHSDFPITAKLGDGTTVQVKVISPSLMPGFFICQSEHGEILTIDRYKLTPDAGSTTISQRRPAARP